MTRRRPEQAIQRALFQHFASRRAQGTFAWHCPNGGYRTPAEARIFAGLGVVRGIPDVHALRDGRFFALELKSERGRLSDSLIATMAALEAAGAVVGTAHGLDEAIAWLEAHHLLRGSAQ
jgi:hypothetical protein